MIPMRQSTATSQNSLLLPDDEGPAAGALGMPMRAEDVAPSRPGGAGGNIAWLRRARRRHGIGRPGDVILLGGASIADFRVRVAQSHARSDLTPSYWSTVGLMEDARTFLGVPLGGGADPSLVPASNGIAAMALRDFDDPSRYPEHRRGPLPGRDVVGPRRDRRPPDAAHGRGPARAGRRLARLRVGHAGQREPAPGGHRPPRVRC